jgi:NAD(P)-dependent dehydrogenase (short-subunit alcohol dehydrogenase family)
MAQCDGEAMTRFDGRVALITGAGRGIGAALAAGLARAGATIAVTDINSALAAASAERITSAGGRAHSYALDVTDAAACARVAAEIQRDLGTVSVLINNAGILIRGPFSADVGATAMAATLAVNVQGMANVTAAVLPHLRTAKGAILNIASIQSFAALRNSVAYAASKGAVAQFTKGLAVELAADGVRVNALAPGIIATDISAATREDPAKLAAFLSRVPMGRFGEPEELVEAALFLCSRAASYVTGVILPVDGGFLAL